MTRALRTFLATEVAGGLALVLAAVAAIFWANSPWAPSYERLWHTELSITVGSWSLVLDLREWINEGLMAIFFLVVGLEVKRELVVGELRERARAAFPVAAAIGGMAVPAAIYIAVNAGGAGQRGWGIPMATDIAFALGVAALVGRRLPPSLRIFLLTLAIVDDIGAIVVIAVFYSDGIAWAWLGGAVGIFGAAFALTRTNLVSAPLFAALGCALWFTLHQSGAHATLAGVAMGLLAPARAPLSREIVLSRTGDLLDVFSPRAAKATSLLARSAVSEVEWLEHALHPWTSMLIVPLFALANAGIPLSAHALEQAAKSPVTAGVVLGLVVGKTFGITGSAWLACRAGLATRPPDATWLQLAGVAALAAIGFTVSLFITGLAFSSPALVDEARIGILASSIVGSLIGVLTLFVADRQR